MGLSSKVFYKEPLTHPLATNLWQWATMQCTNQGVNAILVSAYYSCGQESWIEMPTLLLVSNLPHLLSHSYQLLLLLESDQMDWFYNKWLEVWKTGVLFILLMSYFWWLIHGKFLLLLLVKCTWVIKCSWRHIFIIFDWVWQE